MEQVNYIQRAPDINLHCCQLKFIETYNMMVP